MPTVSGLKCQVSLCCSMTRCRCSWTGISRRRELPQTVERNNGYDYALNTNNTESITMSTTSSATLAQPPSLAEVMRRRKPPRDINKEAADKVTPLDRLALWITIRVGSMGFFLIVFGWTAIWLTWNMLAPASLQFDPPMAFVFWLFISNVIQILLMPLIMVGQNVQGTHAELRAEHDLEVNVKAEEEIEVILRHLEYQNSMLIAMLSKLGVSVAEAMHPNKK